MQCDKHFLCFGIDFKCLFNMRMILDGEYKKAMIIVKYSSYTEWMKLPVSL